MSPSSRVTVQQMVASYSKQSKEDGALSPLMLIQHESCCSLQQRQAAASKVGVDSTLYRRARVRTPSQNSNRNVTGSFVWLFHLAKEFAKHPSRVVWLQTTNSIFKVPYSFQVINAASDPLGWVHGSDSDSVSSLENLEFLARAVEKAGSCASERDEAVPALVLVESLVPIVLRHGFQRTMQWLRRLKSPNNDIGALLLCISTELFSTHQVMALQDECNACFLLQDGEMTLIRQGGRDRGNVMRQEIPFELKVDAKASSGVSLLLGDSSKTETNLATPPALDDTDASQQSETTRPPTRQTGAKIVLQHQDNDQERTPTAANSNRPKIYLQDDDPEFDDLDEEDPDDDLDI